MSTKILDNREVQDLQPAYGLWQLYVPEIAPYHFQAKTSAETTAWQKRTRGALIQTLGFQDWPPVPLSPQKIEQSIRETISERKF